MKRLGCMFLALILSVALVITPVMAKNGGGKSSGGGKGSAVSSSSSQKGSSVGAEKSNKGQGQSNSSKKSGVEKDKANGKTDSNNRGQSQKESKVKSGKKVKDGVDLTRGNKEVVQKRLQSREVKTVKKQFKDAEGHWAQKSIQKVQKLGLIQGYEDGSFNPDAVVSQVEAMVMVVNLAEIINDDSVTDESDVDEITTEDENTDEGQIDETDNETTDENTEDDDSISDEDENTGDVPGWAKNQARKAAKMKVININRFHSEVQASRAQVAVMLAKALELEPVEVDEGAFTDSIKISPEDVGYILALKEAGVITGTPDGKFNPNSSITRAQMAAMLANIVENIEDEEEEDGDQSEDESTVPDEDSENNDTTDPIEDDNTSTDETETDTENTETETENDTPDSSDDNTQNPDA